MVSILKLGINCNWISIRIVLAKGHSWVTLHHLALNWSSFEVRLAISKVWLIHETMVMVSIPSHPPKCTLSKLTLSLFVFLLHSLPNSYEGLVPIETLIRIKRCLFYFIKLILNIRFLLILNITVFNLLLHAFFNGNKFLVLLELLKLVLVHVFLSSLVLYCKNLMLVA